MTCHLYLSDNEVILKDMKVYLTDKNVTRTSSDVKKIYFIPVNEQIVPKSTITLGEKSGGYHIKVYNVVV